MSNEHYVESKGLRSMYEDLMDHCQETLERLELICPSGLLDKEKGPPELTFDYANDKLSKAAIRELDKYFEYWGVEDVPLIDEPADYIPDELKHRLRDICERIMIEKNLVVPVQSDDVPALVIDFMDTLNLIYWYVQYEGIAPCFGASIAGEILSAIKYDALLKAVSNNEYRRLGDCAFANISTEESSDGYYYFDRLIDLRNKLFGTRQKQEREVMLKSAASIDMRKDRSFNIEKANSFARCYGDDTLFPFLAFALLEETNLTRLFADDGDFATSKRVARVDEVLKKIKSTCFFGTNAKGRDFERSMKYLQLFCKCLDGKSFQIGKEPLSVPDITKRQKYTVPQIMSWEQRSYRVYDIFEKIQNATLSYELKACDMMPHPALNLYCFNDSTGLLDWVFAAKKQNSACVRLEGMLFSRQSKIMWNALEKRERDLLVAAYNRVFNITYQRLASLNVDELQNLYDDEVDYLDELAEGFFRDISGFHCLYGQVFVEEVVTDTRAQPQKRLYDTIRKYTEQRNNIPSKKSKGIKM